MNANINIGTARMINAISERIISSNRLMNNLYMRKLYRKVDKKVLADKISQVLGDQDTQKEITTLGIGATAAHLTLDQAIGVRIPDSQPNFF